LKIRSNNLRPSLYVSGFLFMTVVAAAVAVAPVRLAAQESAPAATSQAAAPNSAEAPKADAPKSQEEQNKAFLTEGPIVKWTAKTFGLSPEAAANTFEFINFGLIVLLVGIPIVRILPKVFRKRSQTLVANLQTAREATEAANARLSAVETKLAGLDDEIKKFRAEVEQESLADEARIKAALADESARIVQAAEQELTVAAAQARRGLRNFATDLAIEQAARQLNLTPETDKALIAEFVGQVSRDAAGKGGKN
jgi:F-type H+-transporting ATPase subunit b